MPSPRSSSGCQPCFRNPKCFPFMVQISFQTRQINQLNVYRSRDRHLKEKNQKYSFVARCPMPFQFFIGVVLVVATACKRYHSTLTAELNIIVFGLTRLDLPGRTTCKVPSSISYRFLRTRILGQSLISKFSSKRNCPRCRQ